MQGTINEIIIIKLYVIIVCTSNESDRKLVQGFITEQIQQLAKAINSLGLQVCLSISRLLIMFLRNHGFWIAEQPIILHLIHNLSHTLHHHLFQMLICLQAQLRQSHLRAQLNSMTISLSKMFLRSFF